MTLSLRLHAPDRDDVHAYLDNAGLPVDFTRALAAWASIEHSRGTSLAVIEDALENLADRYRAGEITAETLQ